MDDRSTLQMLEVLGMATVALAAHGAIRWGRKGFLERLSIYGGPALRAAVRVIDILLILVYVPILLLTASFQTDPTTVTRYNGSSISTYQQAGEHSGEEVVFTYQQPADHDLDDVVNVVAGYTLFLAAAHALALLLVHHIGHRVEAWPMRPPEPDPVPQAA